MTLTLLPWRSSKEAMYSGTVVLAIRVRRRFHEAISVVPCKQAQHCCATLRRSQNNKSAGTCYAKSFTGFKSYATSANDVVVPCKWTQHVEPNVACCWPTMLRPFEWAFRTCTDVYDDDQYIGTSECVFRSLRGLILYSQISLVKPYGLLYNIISFLRKHTYLPGVSNRTFSNRT